MAYNTYIEFEEFSRYIFGAVDTALGKASLTAVQREEISDLFEQEMNQVRLCTYILNINKEISSALREDYNKRLFKTIRITGPEEEKS